MLLIAALLASSTPQLERASSSGVTARALAVVRIVSAARLRLGEGAISGEAPSARHAVVHLEGSALPANLIEFE